MSVPQSVPPVDYTPTVSVWEERDRAHVAVWVGDACVAEWWDGEVAEMVEDGFFTRGPRFRDSVLAYCRERGIV